MILGYDISRWLLDLAKELQHRPPIGPKIRIEKVNVDVELAKQRHPRQRRRPPSPRRKPARPVFVNHKRGGDEQAADPAEGVEAKEPVEAAGPGNGEVVLPVHYRKGFCISGLLACEDRREVVAYILRHVCSSESIFCLLSAMLL